MRTGFWGILGLLSMVMLAFLAGCAAGPSYPASESRYYRAYEPGYYRGYEPQYSSPGEVPPYYYDNNPAYEHWFTAPQWMPDVGP